MGETVSVIVPVHNAAAYMEETIAAVCGQTYPDWELLLVDDHSTDESREIIRACAENWERRPPGGGRIRLIAKESNGGAARARNTGLEEATGRYVAFLDADDVWRPDKLERELALMREKNAAFVFSAYEFGDEKAVGTGKVVHVPEILTYRQALSRTVIFTSTVLADTEKLDKELLRMPEVESEDTATWWRILRQGYTAYGLDEVLAVYRRPGKSLSSNKAKAVRRIWRLYRGQEKLSVPSSLYNLVFWAARATLRRI